MMNKFIKKTIIYLALFLVIGEIITIFVPYHWGNPWYSTKIQYLEQATTKEFDTFIFGSSRVYRQIDPTIVDSVYNLDDNDNISSFNLGAQATFCPQTYFLYENFLASKISKHAKYCIIELMAIDMIGGQAMHQERTTYWQNLSEVAFVTKSMMRNSRLTRLKKIYGTGKYYISYIENIFHMGHFGQELITNNYYNQEFLGSEGNGYYPLELNLRKTKDKIVHQDLLERNMNFRNNPRSLDMRKEQAINLYTQIGLEYDKVNLERIQSLIAESTARGIKLLFILSPRNASQEIVNLSEQIPARNKIDFLNPEFHEDLYAYENSFDVAHLNTKGSIEYSIQLGLELKKKLSAWE